MQQINSFTSPKVTDEPPSESGFDRGVENSSTEKSSSKFFQYLGLGILLFAVGGGGYYFGVQQAPRPITTTQAEVTTLPESANSQSDSEVELSPLLTYTQKREIIINKSGIIENELSDLYSISYPKDWMVTSDLATLTPPSSTSKIVYIFRPGDNPSEGFFKGIVIEDVGENPTLSREQLCKIDTEGNIKVEEVVINGTKMLTGGNTHGRVYCANIPDTGSYLTISGFGITEDLADPEVTSAYMAVLNSFKFASAVR